MPKLDPPPGAGGSRAIRQHTPEITEAFYYFRAVFERFTTLDPVLLDLCRLKSALLHDSRC